MSKPIVDLKEKFKSLMDVSRQVGIFYPCSSFTEDENKEIYKFEALLEYVQDWVPDENPWADTPKDWSNWPWE